MLLQEVNGTSVGLPGYEHYVNPSIPHKPTRATNSVPACNGQAAIYIDRSLPQAEIDTTTWCTAGQEIVAVRTQLRMRKYVLVSAYYRPQQPRGTRPDWGWMYHLRQTFPKDIILIGGHFNARHLAWGYGTSNLRGEALFHEAQTCKLQLLNDPDLPTRFGQGSRQNDSTPDLTWASRHAALDWTLFNDPMGSGHLPIFITLSNALRPTSFKRTSKVVKWDRYRELLNEWDDPDMWDDPNTTRSPDLVLALLKAAKDQATTTTQTDPDKPHPDLHLLNLWGSSLTALIQYREHGMTLRLRDRLDTATADAKKYCQVLSQDQWHDLCNQFNGRMHLSTVWNFFRSWQGKSKRRTAALTVALRQNKSDTEFAQEAADFFFPQSPSPDTTCYSPDVSVDGAHTSDAPFTLAEMQDALDPSNMRSAPGPDGVTHAELRNLPTEYKLKILEWINEVWETGRLPGNWKMSLVLPIPKPGKPPTTMRNLRPISLTSNIC
ncbi:hypothetical protein HPB47_010938 [Ixodes persulcatus]|uniref:Uncharacterized protein n=1 Tax=Ixodes persulcatus TaxID=34615 RepID=A0AC60NXV1_IXOPE|nr:hypothetical protein HPB47_010938 [Ixodes persulcatus]